MKNFFSLLFLVIIGSSLQAAEVPDFMQSFVIQPSKPVSKERIALDEVYTLNDNMFIIYDRSLDLFKKNFLDNHPLIMGLFSGKGGRFLLYRPGQPTLEADSVPWVYQVAKSVGHCAMATFQLLAPFTADPSKDLAWLGSLRAYQTSVQTSIKALDAIDLKSQDRDLCRDTLNQINAFMENCIQNRTYTYQQIETFTRTIQPNLAKLIDVATNAQVKHWWGVLENWKSMLGNNWPKTYGLSNSIYVAKQNNILFSILVQFFGEQAMNDRLILLETTDFTASPELMLNAFMRIVSDRMIGGVFFNDPRLMDFELLGGSARRVIEGEANDRGIKSTLPPLVPFNSHEWPMKTNPKSGTGPSLMEEIH